jgi:SAM-dependent methyltransferase
VAKNTDHLFERFYTGRPGYRGGTPRFHDMCAHHIKPGSAILEVGPGPENTTSGFLASLGRLTGADVSDELRGNPALSERHVYDGVQLPFEPNSFDACVSNYVVEHVKDGAMHIREVARVLRPGGVYVFRTSNRHHYVAVLARLMPHRLHLLLANRVRALGADAHDPWPTVYNCNTRRAVHRYAAAAGLEVQECVMIELEPTYGRASPALFYPMMLWERAVNRWPRLDGFRANLFVALRKPV